LLQRKFRTGLFGKAQLQDLRKSEKAPDIFVNCTSLTTGSACFFSSNSFNWYEKKESKDKPGQSSYEARDVSLDETPVWYAVAASSAFPPLFPPIEISNETLVCSKDSFKDVFRLTDGGVYDNLGINRLLERAWYWEEGEGRKTADSGATARDHKNKNRMYRTRDDAAVEPKESSKPAGRPQLQFSRNSSPIAKITGICGYSA
jgi:Patatin-like phospholipase